MAESFSNLLKGQKDLLNIKMRNIQKKILSHGRPPAFESCRAPGGGFIYPKETKFIFHYRIKFANDDIVMDDTRKYGKTMELYSGKDFQLDWWESCLSTMFPGEISSFTVSPERLFNFPAVNKKLRDYMTDNVNNQMKKSCCAGLAMSEHEEHGVSLFGYEDLDDFMKNPKTLEFIFDLISIELPEENKKDTYIMNGEERKLKAKLLRETGNEQFKRNQLDEAVPNYLEAIRLLEQIINMEKQNDDLWIEMNLQLAKINFNLGQVYFKKKDYLSSIEYLSKALERDEKYGKAYYRRAQAYSKNLDYNEAISDYEKAKELLPQISETIYQESIALKNRYSSFKEKNYKFIKERLRKKINFDD